MKNKIKHFIKLKIAKKNCDKLDRDYKTLKKLIEQVDVVSFDMFDTLVSRNVQNPYHIFQIIEQEAKKKFEFNYDFLTIRRAAEDDIYKQWGKITLHNIYEQIQKYGINREICDWLMNKELELEEKFIVKDKQGEVIYNICKEKNKKIVVTSDMYLSKKFLGKKLSSLGYEVDDIFVSGEYGCSKSSGGLYNVIKNELGTNQILHIGDNFHSDFIQARKHGLKAYWIVSKEKVAAKSLNDSIYISLINRTYNNEIEKFGYSFFGPFLYNFCLWIHEKYSKYDKKFPLLFLSRDGYIYYNIYKEIFPNDKTFYVRMSRKTAVLSKFAKNTDLEFVLNSYSVAATISIRELLHCLNLDNGEVNFKQDVDIDQIWKKRDFLKSDYINKIYSEKILPILKVKAKDIQDKLNNYLSSYLDNENTIGIVDDGWRGNIQKALEYNYPERDFVGFYIGYENTDDNKYGYVFDAKNRFKNFYKLAPAMSFFETICAENCGSLLDYEYDDGEVKPVLSSYNKQQQESGLLAESIQKYAVKFVNEFVFYSGNNRIALSGCTNKFLDYMENPPVRFLKEILLICHDDVKVEKIINYSNSKSLFKRFKMAKASTWRYASMKINFIDINYAKIMLPFRVIKRKLSQRR